MTTRRSDLFPAPRTEFGALLRRTREGAGIEQGKELAQKIGVTGDTISRFEIGRRWPRRTVVETIARALDLDQTATAELLAEYDEADALDKTLKSTAPYRPKAAQEDRDKAFRAASEISAFAVTEIPFFLQTLDYARQEVGDDPDAATIAEMRVAAGSLVGTIGKTFDIVITEACLRLLPCTAPAMRRQIAHLQGLVGATGVEFGIIPFGVELLTPLKNGFTIYDDIAVVDTYAGELTLTSKYTPRYADFLERLAEDAVRGAQALDLLTSAINALPNS